uniref:Uncharacterized protein n=1 Tax=Melanopsichium pennsylvanicum 4 TaxID=1398559 RepID=A0A077QY87_9BASI|nr:uncharacterized protein BN887_06023 [Melanopsichium pennsylvanicum 4]
MSSMLSYLHGSGSQHETVSTAAADSRRSATPSTKLDWILTTTFLRPIEPIATSAHSLASSIVK